MNDINTNKRLALASMISAWGIISSTFLVYIPNVETITFSIFMVGILLGKKYGVFSGISTALIYEIVATMAWGPGGIVFPFKLITYILVGLTGGLLHGKRHEIKWWIYSMFGFYLTLFYDFVTTIGPYLIIGQPIETLGIYLLLGTPFYLVHVTNNLVLFSIIPNLLKSLKRLEETYFPIDGSTLAGETTWEQESK